MNRPVPNFDPGEYDGPPLDDEKVTPIRKGMPAFDYSRRLAPGGAFILDTPTTPPSVWGEGSRVIWPQGEPLLIVGPTGVGKSTLAGQVVRGRLGLQHDVLGFPVEPCATRVLYLAMDRPRQIARNLARQFRPDERQLLDELLTFWPGPPVLDLGRYPDTIMEMAQAAGADTVVIDSLKDASSSLSDEETGSGLNRAMQTCVSGGVEVLALHHQRKGQRDGGKPKSIDDVYGSSMITNGAGSVVLLWGQAGDPLVELIHLKQSADTIGPLKVEHHLDGTSSVYAGFDPLAFLTNRPGGATATEAARQMVEKAEPSDSERKKAQRLLDRLVAEGLASKEAYKPGGSEGSAGARYHAATRAS